MADLGRFQETYSLPQSGLPAAGATVTIRKQGATVSGNQSGTTPLTITVNRPGGILSTDTIRIGTGTTEYDVDSVTATTVVAPTIPIREPSETEASLMAAAEAGKPRGVLAKTIAVRTVVESTNPAPMKARGAMNATYWLPKPPVPRTSASRMFATPRLRVPKVIKSRGRNRWSR